MSADIRYRPIIDDMTAVFDRLMTGPKTSGCYDDDRIADLLAAAGVVGTDRRS